MTQGVQGRILRSGCNSYCNFSPFPLTLGSQCDTFTALLISQYKPQTNTYILIDGDKVKAVVR